MRRGIFPEEPAFLEAEDAAPHASSATGMIGASTSFISARTRAGTGSVWPMRVIWPLGENAGRLRRFLMGSLASCKA